MPANLMIKLKRQPAFDIKKDVEQIANVAAKGEATAANILQIPHIRAYILTETHEPVAIFADLPPEAFELFLKIALCMVPGEIEEMNAYADGKAMNFIKKSLKNVPRPFRVAFFVADKLYSHAFVSIDIVLYLCIRFQDHDIIDRALWDFLNLDWRENAVPTSNL